MKKNNEFCSEILILGNWRSYGVIKGIRKPGGASLGFLFLNGGNEENKFDLTLSLG